MERRKVVFKITYPNGKIYVGKDLTNNIRYFGSPNTKLISSDFSWCDRMDFRIRRELLWWSDDATDGEVSAKEVEYIRKLRANHPDVGYNRWPKYREADAMADQADDLVLEMLRAIRADLGDIKDAQREQAYRLHRVETTLGGLRRDQANDAGGVAHLEARVDRMRDDIDRIKRRLDIVD